MDSETRDIIKADDASSLPTDYTPAKDKITTFLTEIDNDDHRNWSAIKTISEGSGVSSVYTRHVLDSMLKDATIERGLRGKKAYFRLKAPQEPPQMPEK